MKLATSHCRMGGLGALVLCLMLVGADASALPDSMVMEEYVSGLKFPVTVIPATNGDLLVAEKFGGVRLVRDGKLLERPIASVDVTAQNEAGLIGLALMPDYATSGEFLILYTPAEPLDKMLVSKLRLEGERARMVEERFIELESRANTDRHYGGNLRFGPDGKLYLTQGDLRDKQLAQSTSRTPGSVLRFNADGSIPDDNPFGAGNPVFAYGLRNPFDLDFDPAGRLYVNTNGEDSTDEINFIEAGKNYGWPLVQGYCDNFPVHEPCQDADLFTDPAFEFRTTVGPTGMTIYKGEMFPDLVGHVLMTGWHSNVVHNLQPAPAGSRLAEGALVQLDPLFRARGELGMTDVQEAADGAILVLFAGAQGGEIRRIIAAPAEPGEPGEPGEPTEPGGPDASDGPGEPGGPDAGPSDPAEPAKDDGCGCASSGGHVPGSVIWLGLVIGAGLWRRRARRHAKTMIS